MNPPQRHARFSKPGPVDALFNSLFGRFVGMGGGLAHNYLLCVRGRRSGRMRSLPVNLLEMDTGTYLVAPRGEAQWVKNVRAASRLVLRRGKIVKRCRATEVPERERARVLQEYLGRYRTTVQRYFTVAADADLEAFDGIAGGYPVFRLSDDVVVA